MGPGYGGEHGFGLMWIFPLLFLAVFIYFMRGMFGRSQMKQDTAREILDKRFARGEIDKEEYEQIKKTLE